jgi:hypothetical protein
MIFARAAQVDRIVASVDTDLGIVLALRNEAKEALIYFPSPLGRGNQSELS